MQKSFLTHLVIVLLLHLGFIIFRGLELPKTAARNDKDVVVMSILESRSETPPRETPPKRKPQKRPKPLETDAAPKEAEPEMARENTPAPSSPGVRDLLAQYKEALRAKIDENKFYPSMSRRMGQRGTSIVGFTLLKDGHIINARILKSSGFSRLDQAALTAVTSVRDFDPIPDGVGLNSMDLEIPVRFTDNT